MTPSSLLPLAGAAIAPVLGKVIEGVTDGLSFLDVLHSQEPADKADTVQAADTKSLDDDIAELAARLRERFAQFGIDLSTPLRLKQDGRDRVVVDGDHRDRVLIESILRDDHQLATLFQEVAESAARCREETESGVTKELHFVLNSADAAIEFA